MVILRSGRTDASQFLKDLAIDVMRRTSRRYSHENCGEAENAIAARIEEEVRDKGFKLSRPAFVKLSLDKTISTMLAGFNLKKKRGDFFASYIKSGDWPTLLGMLAPNDPEYEAIKLMIELTLKQQNMQAKTRQEIIKIAIEKGLIEGWQLEDFAKELLKEVSGLSEQSVALLEGKLNSPKHGDSPEVVNEKTIIPEEISREQVKGENWVMF